MTTVRFPEEDVEIIAACIEAVKKEEGFLRFNSKLNLDY